jgi:hypothetical protein
MNIAPVIGVGFSWKKFTELSIRLWTEKVYQLNPIRART